MQVVKWQDRRCNSTDRLAFTTERRMTWVLDPSHEAGCARLTRTRRRPPSFVTPRTTVLLAPLARGWSPITLWPSFKPCSWMVTDHVMDINSSVRLASALAEPCTASSEHMRSLCSNARPCGARRRTRAAICEYEPCGNHRRTLFGFLLGNHRGEVPSFQCGGTEVMKATSSARSARQGRALNATAVAATND